MGWLSRSERPVPLMVPTDTVVPVPFWNDDQYGRKICVHHTYQFNDVLDTEKLQRSFERLMELGGWGKLGARIRRNHHGKLEYHIPAQYSEKRPGFIFTTAAHSIQINDHPLASKLPKATAKPGLLGDPQDAISLCLPPDRPQVLDDWLYSDRPLLSIHVVSFRDATLLSMSFIHVMMDGTSLGLIYRAWSAVLNDEEDNVPKFRGIDEDPLEAESNVTSAEEYIHFSQWLHGFQMILFLVYTLWEFLWFRREDCRLVCIPGSFVDSLRKRTMQELEESAVKDNSVPNGKESPFLSEGDVLLAWWTRTLVNGLGISPGRRVSLFNVFDTRGCLLRDENTAFITNACMVSPVYLSPSETLHHSLSSAAWQIRRSLNQHRDKVQCQAQLAAGKVSKAKNGTLAAYTDASSVIISCSNLHRGRLYEMDFSAAVICPGVPLVDRTNRLGRPLHTMLNFDTGSFPMRNTGFTYGKDAAGNWWQTWTLRQQAWPVVQRELEMLGSSVG